MRLSMRNIGCGLGLWLGALVGLGFAAPAVASTPPSTRLVTCPAGNCLLVTGHRDTAAALVSINGHMVAVEGGRTWRARLPVETVRAWSPPFARTIDVALLDPAAPGGTTATAAPLPIGLLSHVSDLAELVVRVR